MGRDGPEQHTTLHYHTASYICVYMWPLELLKGIVPVRQAVLLRKLHRPTLLHLVHMQ